MNPQTPPDTRSAPEEHPLYDYVLRMVLWGEEKEEIFQHLAVNEVTGSIANRLYKHARADRIRTIRAEYAKRFFLGVGIIVAILMIFGYFWFILRFIPRIVLFACFGAIGIGLWKTFDGLIGYFMAASKTGSIADEF